MNKFGSIASLLALASIVACSRNVVIRTTSAEDTGTMLPIQKCEPEPAKCDVDPVQDTAPFSDTGGTTFFVMPTCANGIHSIQIENADSSKPSLHVLCSAPKQNRVDGGGIPTTTTSGGISSNIGGD